MDGSYPSGLSLWPPNLGRLHLTPVLNPFLPRLNPQLPDILLIVAVLDRTRARAYYVVCIGIEKEVSHVRIPAVLDAPMVQTRLRYSASGNDWLRRSRLRVAGSIFWGDPSFRAMRVMAAQQMVHAGDKHSLAGMTGLPQLQIWSPVLLPSHHRVIVWITILTLTSRF